MEQKGVVGFPDTEGQNSVWNWVRKKDIPQNEQDEIVKDLFKGSDIVNRFNPIAFDYAAQGDFHKATRMYWRLYFMVDPRNEELRDYLCRSLIGLKRQRIEEDAHEQEITNLDYLIDKIQDPLIPYHH